MFFRPKRSGHTEYLQIVKNERVDGKPRQSVVATLGPALAFERLWQETGCRRVIGELAGKRGFQFDLERAVFLTVLHRLFDPGSDRAAEKWRNGLVIDG